MEVIIWEACFTPVGRKIFMVVLFRGSLVRRCHKKTVVYMGRLSYGFGFVEIVQSVGRLLVILGFIQLLFFCDGED